MQQGDILRLLRLIQTPAGQQLAAYFTNNPTPAVREAAKLAAAGDYNGAKAAIAPLLAEEKLTALLRQLGETP